VSPTARNRPSGLKATSVIPPKARQNTIARDPPVGDIHAREIRLSEKQAGKIEPA
jgi:hypothetical protein